MHIAVPRLQALLVELHCLADLSRVSRRSRPSFHAIWILKGKELALGLIQVGYQQSRSLSLRN